MDQVGRDGCEPIANGCWEPNLNGDILPLDVAVLPQTPLESFKDAVEFRAWRCWPEKPNPGHRRLLRLGGERRGEEATRDYANESSSLHQTVRQQL